MQQTNYQPKGSATTDERRAQLLALVHARGEVAAADAIGISRQTLARAIAGLPIHRSTHVVIAMRLDELVHP